MTTNKVLKATIPLPLSEKVDQMAQRLDRSRGWIVKQALSDWIAQQETLDALTLEGLAEVDAGRLVAQADMEAWAASLGSDAPPSKP